MYRTVSSKGRFRDQRGLVLRQRDLPHAPERPGDARRGGDVRRMGRTARLPAPRCFQGHLRAAELSSYPELVLLGSTAVPDHWAVGCAVAGRLQAGHELHRHPPSGARGGRCPRHLGGWFRAHDAQGASMSRAAWEFFKFYAGYEGQKILMNGISRIPTNLETIKDPEGWNPDI